MKFTRHFIIPNFVLRSIIIPTSSRMNQYSISALVLSTFVVLTLAGPPLQVQNQWTSISQKLGLGSPKSKLFDIEPQFQLPSDKVEAIQYDLTISPILDTAPPGSYQPWTAPGSVIITFKALEASNSITLNKDETLVTVTKPIKVIKDGGPEVRVTGNEYDTNGLWVIHLDTPLEQGSNYNLQIDFLSTIPTEFTTIWSKTGLYGGKYVDEHGNDVWIATTQFETVGFRKMCPGFDEPSYKAVFRIKIGRPADHMSLSNSEMETEGNADPTLPPGYVRDDFKPTVKMSTYLVALVVSKYTFAEADPNILGKPVKVYGPPHMISHNGGVFAADASARILKHFEDRYQIKYAMHKMDSIAIPRNYFAFGAMENWGLNIYRDNALMLYPDDPGKSSENTRGSISSILAHELAHQWFGNLVTTAWWSHIYLNEGFATYVSYFGVESVTPEFDPLNQCIYDAVQPALRVDAGASSHPIINTATEEEILSMTIFDTITYEKGASLIRMMDAFLTRETLQRGLIRYMNDRQFNNAHQDNLFSSLTQQAASEGKNLDIKSIMDTYTLQKGFPLVRVSRGSPTKLYISQERYSNNLNQYKDLDPDTLWEVPVGIVTQDDPSFDKIEPVLWIRKDTSLLSHNIADTSKWVIVNPGGYGYYRVLYDTPLTNLIQQQLETNPTVFDALTRSKLIDDYFRFAEHGYTSWETALGMTKSLGKNPADADHTFWVPALSTLSSFLPLLNGSNSEIDNIKNYVLPKVEAELEYIGWEQGVNEHGVKVLLRASLLDWAKTFDSQKSKDVSNALMLKWTSQPATDPNPVPVDLQAVVYCTAISSGPKDNFDFLVRKYHLETNPLGADHKTRLVNALTCSKSIEQLIWLLRNSIEPNEFNAGHLNTIIKNVHANPVGRSAAEGFVRDNWQKLVEYTATDVDKIQTTVISTAIAAFSVHQNTEQHITQLQNFMNEIEANNKPHYDIIRASLTSSLNTIRANANWIAINRGRINAWFAANS